MSDIPWRLLRTCAQSLELLSIIWLRFSIGKEQKTQNTGILRRRGLESQVITAAYYVWILATRTYELDFVPKSKVSIAQGSSTEAELKHQASWRTGVDLGKGPMTGTLSSPISHRYREALVGGIRLVSLFATPGASLRDA